METVTPVGQGGLFLLQFIVGLVIFALMLRFLLRATHADWHHPIVKFIATVTNPLCAPINKLIPAKGRWDWASVITAVIIQAGFVVLIGFLTDRSFSVPFVALASTTEIANQLLDMMFWLIIIQIVMSWISPGYNPNTVIFDQLTQPILAPFRKLVPPISGMDLSPLFAILAIKLFQIVVIGSITQVTQQMIG